MNGRGMGERSIRNCTNNDIVEAYVFRRDARLRQNKTLRVGNEICFYDENFNLHEKEEK